MRPGRSPAFLGHVLDCRELRLALGRTLARAAMANREGRWHLA